MVQRFIIGFLLLFGLFNFVFKGTLSSSTKSFKGFGISCVIPQGWEKSDQKIDLVDTRGVVFVTKEKNSETQMPKGIISIIGVKPQQAIWVEDEFPNFVSQIEQSGAEILDKGEIKVDDEISKWVVFYEKEQDILNIEFYVNNESGIFYRITYSAEYETFNLRRPEFETLKDSIKFSFFGF